MKCPWKTHLLNSQKEVCGHRTNIFIHTVEIRDGRKKYWCGGRCRASLMKSGYVKDNLAGKNHWMSALECDVFMTRRAAPSVQVNIWHCFLRPKPDLWCHTDVQLQTTHGESWRWFPVSRGTSESIPVLEISLGCSSLSPKIFIAVLLAVCGAALCCKTHQRDITTSGPWNLWFGTELLDLQKKKKKNIHFKP